MWPFHKPDEHWRAPKAHDPHREMLVGLLGDHIAWISEYARNPTKKNARACYGASVALRNLHSPTGPHPDSRLYDAWDDCCDINDDLIHNG